MTRFWAKAGNTIPIVTFSAFVALGQSTAWNPVYVKPIGLVLLTSCALIWSLARENRKSLLSPVSRIMCLWVIVAVFSQWKMPTSLGRWLALYSGATLNLAFFLMAVVPLLFGREPFTHWFAKKTNPRAVWETREFITINRTMTWVWAGLFALAGLSGWLGGLAGHPDKPLPGLSGAFYSILFTWLIPAALLLGIGWPYTKLYPARAQRKMGIDPEIAEAAWAEERAGQVKAEPDLQPGQPLEPKTDLPAERINDKETPMSEKLKIVAVNGSPHVGVGNTCQMLAMLADELAKYDAELEEISLHEKNYAPCVGCAVCLEKGKCWQQDDHRQITEAMLAADGIILASPVYIYHVTGQMKTFLDRCLPLGHKPRGTWKPGLAVSVSAGYGETGVADYLGNMLRIFGAFPVGRFTALAVSPGGFLGKEAVQARAADLARDLVSAIRDKRRFPPTDRELQFWEFMGGLVKANKEFMAHDDQHWREKGLYDSFEAYVGMEYENPNHDPELRKAWVRQLIADNKSGRGADSSAAPTKPGTQPQQQKETEMPKADTPTGAGSANTCAELIKIMPLGFDAQAAGDLNAVIQFDISGEENFTAHLKIAEGKCEYADGPAENPTLTVISPAKIWLEISQGKRNGQMAFMTGKFKTKGDMGLLLKLNSLFKG